MRTICAALLLFLATSASGDSPTCAPNYAYEGFTKPSQWRYIDARCATGQQSPITIAPPLTPAHDGAITVSYYNGGVAVAVKNSGHDFRVIPPPPTQTMKHEITVPDLGMARLDNFHFHVPAEHRIPGYGALAGEIHFVHKTPGGGTVVIAVLLSDSGSANNSALQPIIAAIQPSSSQPPIHLCDSKTVSVNLRPLLPPSIPSYYRYVGSLTTPGCDPGIVFLIRPTPMTIGAAQLGTLRSFGANARPPQPRITNPGTGAPTQIKHVTPR